MEFPPLNESSQLEMDEEVNFSVYAALWSLYKLTLRIRHKWLIRISVSIYMEVGIIFFKTEIKTPKILFTTFVFLRFFMPPPVNFCSISSVPTQITTFNTDTLVWPSHNLAQPKLTNRGLVSASASAFAFDSDLYLHLTWTKNPRRANSTRPGRGLISSSRRVASVSFRIDLHCLVESDPI